MSDAEIVKEFLVESYENLDRLDQELIALEKDRTNKETLASIFRTIHTIKGTSGFLAFNKLESLTHAGENLLARLRDGLLALTPEITTALLAMVDAVRQMLASIQASGTDGDEAYPDLMQELTRLQQQTAAPGATEAAASASAAGPAANEVSAAAPAASPVSEAKEFPSRSVRASTGKNPQSDSHKYRPITGRIGAMLVERDLVRVEDLALALAEQERGDSRRLGEILVARGVVKAEDVLAAQQALEARNRSAELDTIRVDVAQLDRLMNGMSELVLLRNQIVQYTNSTDDSELQGTSQRLNLLTTELQEGVMKTRMQPIGNIWSKFPRTVRDVAVGCGKQVRIEMEGKETELDKTIIEAIKDPLTHLVRNAVDHGIESPEVRRAAGKDAEGLLFLRAFHEGGQVNIEITDDGAGLDFEKIRNKAIQKALVTADQAARMTEREITHLIFLPGFSTAEKVTNVSGRGVGMDVVRTNIEKIGGTVDVQSKPGQGSTVRMKIPLTLAIIPALIVASGGDRYAIPQVSLLELLRLEGEQSRRNIELVNGAPVYRLRGRLLPLVYLNRELEVCVGEQEAGADSDSQAANIVVLRADDRQFGLVVDEINDTEEIVVKPLSKQLKVINIYSGATIMGDGKVALILDVMGLAQRANVISETRDRALAEREEQPSLGAADGKQCNAVLLFQHGENGRMAVDLALVARLEEFSRNTVEVAAEQEVVQYRGQIMPLVRVSEVLEGRHRDAAQPNLESLQVVVYSDKGRSVGLVVDRILDIVEESFVMQRQTGRKGILGSAIIQKRVTDILDVPGLIAATGQNQLLAAQS